MTSRDCRGKFSAIRNNAVNDGREHSRPSVFGKNREKAGVRELLLDPRCRRKIKFVKKSLEPRFLTYWVHPHSGVDPDYDPIVVLIGLFQKLERTAIIVQPDINGGKKEGRNVTMRGSFTQTPQDLFGRVTTPGFRVGAAQSGKNCSRIVELRGTFELSNGTRQVPFRLESPAQVAMREAEVGIQLKRPLKPRNGVVKTVLKIIRQTGFHDDYSRHRIECESLLIFGDGFFFPAHQGEEHGIPLVSHCIARVQIKGAFEFNFSGLPIPVIPK